MTDFMHGPFVEATQNTLDADAELCQLARMMGLNPAKWPLTVRLWLAANTWEMSRNPADWAPELRDLWADILAPRMEA